MGPGTHVNARIRLGVQPTTDADKSSMIHDVNYILASGNNKLLDLADTKAINRLSKFDPLRRVMEIGLEIRQKLGLYVGKDMSETQLRNAQELKEILIRRFPDISASDFVA